MVSKNLILTAVTSKKRQLIGITASSAQFAVNAVKV
jgi:hypothetical protein